MNREETSPPSFAPPRDVAPARDVAGGWEQAIRLGRMLVQPAIFLPVIGIIYLCMTVPMLQRIVNDPARATRFIREDSRHYYDIGQAFAGGDFSMQYVKKKPHRQPLYPLLLAPAIRWGGGMFSIGMVNIVVGLLTLPALYFSLRRVTGSELVAAAVTAGGFVGNSFLMWQTGTQVMTEPLFILLEIPILLSFLEYLRSRDRRWLWLASAAGAASYLTRTNGLFIWMALLGTLFLQDLWKMFRATAPSFLQRAGRLAGAYAVAVAVAVVCMAPSWVPRLRDYGTPIYHGHLTNYMWVDTYEEARSQGEQPAYSWRDYAATHQAGDYLKRWWNGFSRVCYRVPVALGPTLLWLALLGLMVAVATRNGRYLLLAFFCFVQLQPLIWANLTNPSKRISYPGVVCFEWFFAACALSWLVALVGRRTPGGGGVPGLKT